VNKLRTKNTTYKQKKAELSGLRAELGVLARTEEVLGQRHDVLDHKLVLENSSNQIKSKINFNLLIYFTLAVLSLFSH